MSLIFNMWIMVELILHIGIIGKFAQACAGDLATCDSDYLHPLNPQRNKYVVLLDK